MNIEQHAAALVAEAAAAAASPTNWDDIRADISDRIHETADSLCIYHSDCLRYIDELESDHGWDVETGRTFEAHEWREAMQACAYHLVTAALSYHAAEALDDAEERYEEFAEVVEELGGDPDGASTASDCAYGWEAHNYETAEGVHVWSAERDSPNGCFNPRLLEGELIAVSHRLTDGLWINVAWKPE